MKIAVTYENGQVFQHFGRTAQFKVYEIENGSVVKSEVVGTDGRGHSALAQVLTELKADTLICGGIGGGAQLALAAEGIRLCAGVSGDADEAVRAFLANELNCVENAQCDHHDHEHHHDHDCGSHGCGGHCGGH